MPTMVVYVIVDGLLVVGARVGEGETRPVVREEAGSTGPTPSSGSQGLPLRLPKVA